MLTPSTPSVSPSLPPLPPSLPPPPPPPSLPQVVSWSLWGGYLYALTPSKINDRFLLGGPSTLRGFGMWGAGPRERGFSLGGEAYWASGVHLFAPLPLLPRTGLFSRIRLHSFATAGNLLRRGEQLCEERGARKGRSLLL